MTHAEAINLVGGDIEVSEDSWRIVEELIKRLGHLPLGLKLASLKLKGSIRIGGNADDALVKLAGEFKDRGILSLDTVGPEGARTSIVKILADAMRRLSGSQQQALRRIAQYRSDSVPSTDVPRVLRLDSDARKKVLEGLEKHGFVQLSEGKDMLKILPMTI